MDDIEERERELSERMAQLVTLQGEIVKRIKLIGVA